MGLFRKIYRGLTGRYDGRPLRSIGPFVKMIPYIMPRRTDAHIFSKLVIETDSINSYIREKHQNGIRITYLHFFLAVLVRVIAQRPQLNRFVMNNRYFARNRIWISMAIKRSLKDEGEETTVKFKFTGRENIFEVANIVDRVIGENRPSGTDNETDKLAGLIMSLPNVFVKLLMGLIRQMDKWNWLPGALIEASPFHTSLFFTYLKSIKLDYVYHHIYDFGNTGLFISLGREKKIPAVEGDRTAAKRAVVLGITIDERICDGLYFSNSVKLLNRYLVNPYLLEKSLEEITEDVD